MAERDWLVAVRTTPLSKEASALLERWSGEVTLVKADADIGTEYIPQRYGRVFDRVNAITLSWQGKDEHSFCMTTGACIASSDGRMRGWKIAPWEMHRYNARKAEEVAEMNRAGTMSVGAVAGGGVELSDTKPTTERADVHPNPLWQVQRETTPKQTSQTLGRILVIVPSAIFPANETQTAAKAMLNRAGASCDMTDAVVVQTGDAVPPGSRFDLVLTTDDAFGWIGRDGASLQWKWWKLEVQPRRTMDSTVEFVSTHTVIRSVRGPSQDA